MASSAGPVIREERYRPPEPKPTKNPRAKSVSLKHKTRSPADAVKESERSLNQLLEDFEGGRLNAFGNSDMLQKMHEIREMQEQLTLKHFEIDQTRISQESATATTTAAKDKGDSSLQELTQALEKLGSAIQSLHSDDARKRSEGKKRKKVFINTEEEGTSGRITPV